MSFASSTDSLAGLGSFAIEGKALQNTGFAGCATVYQTGRSGPPLARLKRSAFCTVSRRSSSSIGAAIDGRFARPGPGSARAVAAQARARLGSGSGPGEAHRRHAQALGDLGGRDGRARTPRSSRRCGHAASRRGRSAPATRSARSRRPTASGQRATRSARPACGPKRASSPRTESAEPVQGSPPPPGRPRPGSAERVRRRDHGLVRARDRSASTPRRRRVELGEHVVEQQERRRRRAAPPPRAGARGRASRCSPWEPKLRRSRSPARIADVVEVRPEPGRAAGDVGVEPGLERRRRSAARRRRRAARRAGRSSPASSAKPGSSAARRRRARLDEVGAERRRRAPSTARRASRGERPSCTRRSAALRCASAAA